MVGQPICRDVFRCALTVFVIASCLGLASARAEIVYDNTTNPQAVFYPVADGALWGDEITLAGTARLGQQLQVGVYSTLPTTADTWVSLYTYTPASPTPWNLLGSADLGPMDYPQGATLVATDLAGLALPETFVWFVEFGNRSNPSANIGPLIYDPPTVGSSGDYFWYDDGTFGGPAAYYFTNHTPVANFAAIVTAEVPEPGTLALLAAGLVVLGFAVRRRGRLV